MNLICSIAQVGATWHSDVHMGPRTQRFFPSCTAVSPPISPQGCSRDLVRPRLGHTLVHQTSSNPSCFQKTNFEGKRGDLLPAVSPETSALGSSPLTLHPDVFSSGLCGPSSRAFKSEHQVGVSAAVLGRFHQTSPSFMSLLNSAKHHVFSN